MSRLRHTLGGVDYEKGYRWSVSGSSYYARQEFFPSLISNQDLGFLIPVIRNTSFWIRNNYVDWREARQYRSGIAFPGADIDEVNALRYIRTMAELNTKPIRTRNIGTTWLYPTFIYTSLFSTHLAVNPFYAENKRHLFNAGFQTDIEMVLLSYMKTTWSVGYARAFEKGQPDKGQWLLSIKLLGR